MLPPVYIKLIPIRSPFASLLAAQVNAISSPILYWEKISKIYLFVTIIDRQWNWIEKWKIYNGKKDSNCNQAEWLD